MDYTNEQENFDEEQRYEAQLNEYDEYMAEQAEYETFMKEITEEVIDQNIPVEVIEKKILHPQTGNLEPKDIDLHELVK